MDQAINSSLFYGLVPMFGWGIINFAVGIYSKKIGSFKTAFIAQSFTLFPLLLLFPFFANQLVLSWEFLLITPED